MKGFDSETEERDENNLLSAALEARLAHIEELIGDLHDWMRSEQVTSLPGPYRRLFSHLVANDFERRYAANITRAVFQRLGAHQAEDAELHAAAAGEIDSALDRFGDGLANVKRRGDGGRPFVIALVGSSGAGKTTLMYKLAVRSVLEFGLKVKIISSDTYKIGSVEGVQTIADILSVPFGIAFEADEVRRLIEDSNADLVILDTAGRSDRAAREELSGFLAAANPDEMHLVLSATMSQRALQETAALFLGERLSCVTFTKLDEAPSLGAMISSAHWMGLPLGYISPGTAIPDDLLSAADTPLGEWAVDGVPLPDHDMETQHV
ncbi:MAG: Flagellar biosynthesis protein FlhF [Chlorobi bacterium]|nr:Flagellar biosynthesis protein FlhF [Chlorobiota bacterium]